MKFNKNLISLLLFTFLFLIMMVGLGKYFSKVNFIGDFNINLNSNNNKKYINFFSTTPTGKQQIFYSQHDSVYNLSGYYKDIYISIDSTLSEKTVNEDTLFFCFNDKQFTFSLNEILNNWERSSRQDKIIYFFPYTMQNNTGLISKLNAVLFYTDFAPIPVILYFIVCFLIVIAVFVYTIFKGRINLLFQKTKPGYFLFFLGFLTIIYFITFLRISSFSDTVELSGDSWEYQVMGVNFAKGHGIQRLSLLEPYDTYHFDSLNADIESAYNLSISPYYIVDTYRTPVYSIFLGCIYKVVGVVPIAIKTIQLLLLCFVAAFLPYVLKKIWTLKGFIAGLSGGFVFLLMYYKVAGEIMTETLLVFFAFLIVWLSVEYNKKQNILLSICIGIVMAFTLLTKGMLIFVPVFFFFALFIHYIRPKENFQRKSIRIIIISFAICLLPWSFYASYVNKFLQIEPLSKEQIINATGTVDSIFENTIITQENIIIITDSIAEIYYKNNYWEAERYHFVKDFIIAHPQIIIKTYANVIDFVKKEMNKFYLGHLKYYSIPFLNKKYLYINFDGLTLLTIQPKTLLLESNNEHCTDGGWHQEARHETYYYKTDNPERATFVRVLGFYFKNSHLIFSIIPAKFYAGFKNFIFLQLLVILIIASIIKNSKRWLLTKLFIIIPVSLFLVRIYPPMLFLLMILALIISFVRYFRGQSPYPFAMPKIVNFFFINIFLITLIFYGLDRFSLITEFLVIPITLMYLTYLIRDIFREGNTITK